MIKHSTATRSSRGLQVRLAALLLIAMLAFPALAAAQSPTADQYNQVPPPVSTSGGGGDPSDPSALGGNVGPLPFTGFDVIAMLAVALAVTGVGLALQRAVSRESTTEI
jgi:hypothetical protein